MIYDKKIHIFLIYVILGLSMHASTNHRRDHLLEGFGATRVVLVGKEGQGKKSKGSKGMGQSGGA
jgi:predicted AAA+ superfamily ATPase